MNNVHTTTVIGLMSGTSLDGITAAAARFSYGDDAEQLEVELLGWRTTPYTAERRARLAAAMEGVPPAEYCRLRVDLAHWFADAALSVIADCGLDVGGIDVIASHGQTIWHEPGHSTWQLGDPATIAERTGVDVVHDFRGRDVAAGGQGAPLVPIADRLLFAHHSRWRALQNLGGIGNVTAVPPGGAARGLSAFDTGPGVAVVDAVVRRLRPSLAYDEDGRLAAAGSPVTAVVDACLVEPYFATAPPKSTGRELFGVPYADRLIAACREHASGCTDEDIVATAVSLTARSIGDAYSRWLPAAVDEVVLSGGGARNGALVAAIVQAVAPRRVVRFDELFFDGEAKEAVAFALLGHLYLRGRPGNVPSATGARGPRVLGSYTPGGSAGS
ncbi:MAG: anhydro-N-acetylmuramic acid kinase [Gemmatimonadaceae bacterium]